MLETQLLEILIAVSLCKILDKLCWSCLVTFKSVKWRAASFSEPSCVLGIWQCRALHLVFPPAHPHNPCDGEALLFQGGCSRCWLFPVGGCSVCGEVQSGTWLSSPQLSGWHLSPGIQSTRGVALAQPPLSPKQQGNWRKEAVSWSVALCSRLKDKSLHLITGLCFSLVYRYSNDILQQWIFLRSNGLLTTWCCFLKCCALNVGVALSLKKCVIANAILGSALFCFLVVTQFWAALWYYDPLIESLLNFSLLPSPCENIQMQLSCKAI